MFPIRDNIPSRTKPYVTWVLIAINLLVFFYEMGLHPRELNKFLLLYGVVPGRYTDGSLSVHFTFFEQFFSFFSYMFLHGGLMHILGNLWILYVFGDNVEDWLGHKKFALYYVGWGIGAAVLHLLFNWSSQSPVVGASGAIAGVMGAYFLLYPNARVKTLIFIFIFIQFIDLPAFVFLGLWFLMQLFSGTIGGASGIAWWAHIGGFAMGALTIYLMGGARLPRKRKASNGWGEHRGQGAYKKERDDADDKKIDDYWH